MKNPTEKMYDAIILGAGPAGLSAAIYSARYGLKTLVISRNIGGQPARYDKIENYPGFIGSSKNLMKNFHKQALKFKAEFLNDEIIDIFQEKNDFFIETAKHKIRGKSIIISLGAERKKLGIEGEDKFSGKGVSYCATCDAPFFKNKTTMVIGGSNAACEAAMILSEHCKKVLCFIEEKA